MRESKVLKKIRASQCARVCGMGHYLPFFIRYAAHFQYDAIWFDLEHRAMTQREVQSVLAMCRAHDIDCMVRPPTLERSRLYRYLEDGATGFMMPFVADAEAARQIVRAALNGTMSKTVSVVSAVVSVDCGSGGGAGRLDW